MIDSWILFLHLLFIYDLHQNGRKSFEVFLKNILRFTVTMHVAIAELSKLFAKIAELSANATNPT